MKKLTLALSLLSVVLLGQSTARAETPDEGTRELRLGGTAGPMGIYGPGIASYTPEHGSDLTLVSMGAGLGYFLSSNVALGGSIGYFQLGGGGGDKMKGPGLSAFLRLYMKTASIGLFAEPTLEFQYLSQGDVSLKILGLGVDAGFEFFLAQDWAVRVSPSYRYYKEWLSGDEASVQKIGLTWGIAAYF